MHKKIAVVIISFLAITAAIFGIYHTAVAPGTPSKKTADMASQHHDVITTIFWVGEPSDSDNGYIANAASAWDERWQSHYGGFDSPAARNGYVPATFVPRENPFYAALPYNDITASGNRKASASSCEKYQPSYDSHYSACKNIWIAIQRDSTTAYAQWEDVGPFGEDDASYVFGTAQPRNTQGAHAGLDVSPAIRDYLHLQDVDRTDWHFVDPSNVPEGPWKDIITTSRGSAL